MVINSQSIVGKIVAENYKAASIFKKYNIDFCCNGNRTIADACNKKQIDENRLIDELSETINTKEAGDIDVKLFPLDLLTDYIEKTHHRYVEKKIPEITPFLQKVVSVHSGSHPELIEVEQLFFDSTKDLSAHMKKEELMLFPYIRLLVKTQLSDGKKPQTGIGSAATYIEQMEQEHTAEGERFRRISELTGNYTPPEDACNTYRVTLSLLKEFEEDLHRHIHLENNILFPRSVQLEQQLER
ncbi:regulator of cell morphogenesis and NO signaling [Porphyromonadaceae bacterium NLAE-zl-C104]|jgi:regulator of cell morphogenesis and NO signaling|uniref:iron-sulfur cluster repair di-iron protein n=1 Tax=Proteiniphilum saccharofermentans TaxID=1642647 RepID=UPI000898382D|nr:iron-sulfur cluster repair di-iron protein [Proteiniphilum saccharofermentans]SDZ85564.1 regulator of cell morphogenesis and NO signaling [Porphyromonadaceae bacterium KH3R12]SFT00941.1 regulator of cell morphogenesis and NO signaling [Porphyromonadaceae bacterium NLAE-zl-C104]